MGKVSSLQEAHLLSDAGSDFKQNLASWIQLPTYMKLVGSPDPVNVGQNSCSKAEGDDLLTRACKELGFGKARALCDIETFSRFCDKDISCWPHLSHMWRFSTRLPNWPWEETPCRWALQKRYIDGQQHIEILNDGDVMEKIEFRPHLRSGLHVKSSRLKWPHSVHADNFFSGTK